LALFEERKRKLSRAGKLDPADSVAVANLRAATVPPYDPGKFPNKWRKMEADQPARTLMAHLGKDSYSHIHYDSAQARTISVREAARLQSFPDGFVFSGTMNPAFRQVGNAVPPLLVKAIAESLLQQVRIAATSLRHATAEVA
jgi:DNA (cytosine-5)-methyltransferase 1